MTDKNKPWIPEPHYFTIQDYDGTIKHKQYFTLEQLEKACEDILQAWITKRLQGETE